MKVLPYALITSILFATISSLSSASPYEAIKESNSHFARVNGIKIHYVENGKGPVVILLHGWPETSYSWRKTMIKLSEHYRVIAPDLRGLGLSERTRYGYDKKTIATDIKYLMDYLGVKKAVIIGHDMGGKAAYVMAHLYPNYVAKLILVDCLIPGTENADALHGGAWHYGFHQAQDIPELLTNGREKEYIRAQIKAWSFNKDAIDDNTIEHYAKYYSSKGGMTAGFNYYRTLVQDAAMVKSFNGARLTMPVMAVSGQYGVADKLPLALANETTHLKTIIVADSGHFVAEEKPDIFNEIVINFIEDV